MVGVKFPPTLRNPFYPVETRSSFAGVATISAPSGPAQAADVVDE